MLPGIKSNELRRSSRIAKRRGRHVSTSTPLFSSGNTPSAKSVSEITFLPPPKPSLISLPHELLRLILQHLLPQGQTYRQRSLVPPSHPSKAPRIIRVDESVEWAYYDWTRKVRRYAYDDVPPIIHALLLTHPVFYSLLVTEIYATNTLHFPDAFTLDRFTSVCSRPVLTSIRTLSIDACGMAVCTRYGLENHTVYQLPADYGIVEAIRPLRNLRDLRICGIGPGVRKLMAMEWWGGKEWVEDRRVWNVEDVKLLMGIVGVVDEDEEVVQDSSEKAREPGPLAGGSIYHCRIPPKQQWTRSTGILKIIGVRIVAKDFQDVQMDQREVKMEDVSDSLRRMKQEAERVRNADELDL